MLFGELIGTNFLLVYQLISQFVVHLHPVILTTKEQHSSLLPGNYKSHSFHRAFQSAL